MRIKHINTHYYNAVFPVVPPEQMEEAGHRAEEMLKASIPTFAKRWDDEWLPELRGYHERWNAFDLSGASIDDLLVHMEWTLDTYRRLWAIHFEVAVPFLVAPSMFFDLYEDVFGSSEALHAYKLLQGVENFSFVAGRELWTLGEKADTEAVRGLIRDTPTSEVVAALEASDGGGEFLGHLRTYLNDFGTRSDTIVELADPSWIEDPAIAIEMLKHYLAEDADDPADQWSQLVAEREQFVADARERIVGYPEPVRNQFEMFLAAGQNGQRIQEDHNWWIDQKGNHQVRQVALEFGRRFANAGVINSLNDIFYLDGDEIREISRAGITGDWKATVAERKAEMDRWSEVHAPPMIGTDYGPPPDNPVTRALNRFFGGPPPAPDPERPDVIRGNAGAPGTVTGTARVIIKLSDAGRLSKGDILVTATTAPPWTPLFATAGGIVTDTGGALSHCAIVAREYGLPAVVGTGMATAMIQDGQTIEVNGDAGEVRIVGEN
ncbi:MAG: PEP-utilizing enzyme [Chloroflexi bacterium]|nr:PEP-utilizing enzyme [Chloroflexota bacterium]